MEKVYRVVRFFVFGLSSIPRILTCVYDLRRYKETIKDYNFGSLIRTDARDEYSETNTIFSKFSKHPPTSLADSD